jgi:hypothetical protein
LPRSRRPAARIAGRRLRPRPSLPLALSLGIAGSYLLFAALAAAHYPSVYGPWSDNTLSQLGNVHLNPNGYVLYLVGCALAGAFAIAFFVSLGRRRASGTSLQRWLVLLLQALGVVGGFALIMNAIFPENEYAQHHFWAGVVFNSFAVAALVAIPALWREGGLNFVLIAFDIAAFAAVILMFVFAKVHWVEWVPGGMFLLFPIVLAISPDPPAPSPNGRTQDVPTGEGEMTSPQLLPSPLEGEGPGVRGSRR